MSYRWVEHTAELGLELDGTTERRIFEDALAAFRELAGGVPSGEPEVREIRLNASDRGDLLTQWLDELVFLADSEGFVAARILELDLWEDALLATVEGASGSPRPLVKAVTYHDLRFEQHPDGWRAYVVLDV